MAEDEMVGLSTIIDSMVMSLSKLWETVKDREAWRAAVHGVKKSQTQFSGKTSIRSRALWLWYPRFLGSLSPLSLFHCLEASPPARSWYHTICPQRPSLSFAISRNLLKLISIESVMPFNHLILCHPLLLLPSVFPSSRVFSNESEV